MTSLLASFSRHLSSSTPNALGGLVTSGAGEGIGKIQEMGLLTWILDPPLPGPLAYVPFLCRFVAALILAPLVVLMLLDLIAYLIARTLHLYPTRIRLPRSPPLTKDVPLVVVSAERGDKDGTGKSSLRHRKVPSGDGHEDKETWSTLTTPTSHSTITPAAPISHGHFSTATSPSVSILPSRTPSAPGSPRSPLSTISLLPLGEDGQEGEEEGEHMSHEDSETSDIEREKRREDGEEVDEDDTANVSTVIATSTSGDSDSDVEDGDATIQPTPTSHTVLRKRVGKGKFDWEGMTLAANGTALEQEKKPMTRSAAKRRTKGLVMTSSKGSTTITNIPRIVESNSGVSSAEDNEDDEETDPNSSPARARKYNASQRRYRASSVGVEGALGLSEGGSESSDEVGGLGLDDEEVGRSESGEEAGEDIEKERDWEKQPAGSLIDLGTPVL